MFSSSFLILFIVLLVAWVLGSLVFHVAGVSLLFNHRGSPWGRRAVGGRAHRSSLREDTDPEQNVARIVSPNTGSAGGKGSLGREGHPPRRRRQCGR